MIRRVLRVLVIELLSSLSLSCGASGQVPPPPPAPPLGGLPPDRQAASCGGAPDKSGYPIRSVARF